MGGDQTGNLTSSCGCVEGGRKWPELCVPPTEDPWNKSRKSNAMHHSSHSEIIEGEGPFWSTSDHKTVGLRCLSHESQSHWRYSGGRSWTTEVWSAARSNGLAQDKRLGEAGDDLRSLKCRSAWHPNTAGIWPREPAPRNIGGWWAALQAPTERGSVQPRWPKGGNWWWGCDHCWRKLNRHL